MPDATNTVKVDGVEPSISVKLLDEVDNPERVKLFTSDDGTYRFLVKGGDPVLVTNTDLGILGQFAIEITDDKPSTHAAAEISSPPAGNRAEAVLSPINPPSSPGQSGQ